MIGHIVLVLPACVPRLVMRAAARRLHRPCTPMRVHRQTMDRVLRYRVRVETQG